MFVLASLSLVELDGAHWRIETELNNIGYGKRVQILHVRHSLGLHTIVGLEEINSRTPKIDILVYGPSYVSSREWHWMPK